MDLTRAETFLISEPSILSPPQRRRRSQRAPVALRLKVSHSGAMRRIFSAAEKLRIVRAAAACTERGSIEALLRREGIYSSLLAAWRKQLGLHGVDGLAGH